LGIAQIKTIIKVLVDKYSIACAFACTIFERVKHGSTFGLLFRRITRYLVATLGLNPDDLLTETVTALDRANAEDAILPLPKLHTQEKKRKHDVTKPSGDIQKRGKIIYK
jgi:hypothetical protein